MIRISGPATRTIAQQLLDPTPSTLRHATRCAVRGHDRATIDEVVATLYVAPHSFTGEDLLEISTHGGLVVPTAGLAAAIAAGACEAAPGEFTRRACENGRIVLTEAGGFADLIEASPAAGFVSKSDLSANAIGALLER